jgi:hypothetical protein
MNSISTTLRKPLLGCVLAMNGCLLATAAESRQALGPEQAFGFDQATALEQMGEPAQVAAQDEEDGAYWLAVSDNLLDGERGGFDFGNGLKFSIGIERATYINGALITTTSFNFNNLERLGPELAAQINQSVLALIQNGPRNTMDRGPTAAVAQGAGGRSNASASAPGVVQNASSVAPPATSHSTSTGAADNTQTTWAAARAEAAANASTASAATIIQNLPSALPATFIQNTLNNQEIRNMTVINATVNSMGMMKSMHSLATLQQALNNAINARM